MSPAETLDRLSRLFTTPIAGSDFTVFGLLLIIVAFVVLVWATGRLARWLTEGVFARRGIDPGIAHAFATALRYLVIVLGFFVILGSVGVDLTALTVLFGALGVGLGFGLQNVADNFVSGLIILFERPIKIGDRVEVGETDGIVREIGARATTIVTDDNIAIIVPNSEFISERVINWTFTGRVVRLHVPVGVAYAADPDQVRHLLLEVAGAHGDVLATPAPEVYFTEFGDSSLNFELLVWTSEVSEEPLELESDLNFAIARKFREQGIEIPFPQRDLNIRSGVLEVRRARGGRGSGDEATAG